MTEHEDAGRATAERSPSPRPGSRHTSLFLGECYHHGLRGSIYKTYACPHNSWDWKVNHDTVGRLKEAATKYKWFMPQHRLPQLGTPG